MREPEEIAAKMDSLGVWKDVAKANFAVKPRGVAFPYFCTAAFEEGTAVRVRFFMLEGWQTLHDYVRTRADPCFGFYSSPTEMPHLELVFPKKGDILLSRHDPGYSPDRAAPKWRALASRILWEAYGVMLRIEADRSLPMKYAEDRAIFARVEGADGTWRDEPLPIPDPPPHVEHIPFVKEDVQAAKDLPVDTSFAIELDFGPVFGVMTKEPRPKTLYALRAFDSATGSQLMNAQGTIGTDVCLRTLWESMPSQTLKELVKIGRIPGEIKVKSARVFRMLRPLCMHLPLRLSLHDSLPRL